VNCNVCEKTLCYTAEPTDPPCDLSQLVIKPNQKLCPGETIHFSWSGNSPSGEVDIYLVNTNNPGIHYVIATSVSNGTNSFSYTIPADFPCGPQQYWQIVIKDPKTDCLIRSERFVVDCCQQNCDCGRWTSEGVKITQVLSADNGNVQFERSNTLLQKAAGINIGVVANCGEKVTLKRGSYVLNAPNYICTPEDCAVIYEWKVEHVNSGAVTNGTGKNFAYQFAQPGVYNVTITPICGGKRCEPWRIQVHVQGLIGTPWPADVLIGKDKGNLLP
ncbi:MAG TPA: GPI anchored serine-threonine rich family protein, partial [Sphingobacterium sp.]|nr:GPI anchored serine-threonine rich family protein [Sphingobacterium sp.]